MNCINKRTIGIIITVVVLTIVLLQSVEASETEAIGELKMFPSYLRLELGIEAEVEVKVNHSAIPATQISWSSSASDIATVSKDDVYINTVISKKIGLANIRALDIISNKYGVAEVAVIQRHFPEPDFKSLDVTSVIEPAWATQEFDLDMLLTRVNRKEDKFSKSDFDIDETSQTIKLTDAKLKSAYNGTAYRYIKFPSVSAGATNVGGTVAFSMGFITDPVVDGSFTPENLKVFSLETAEKGQLLTYTDDPKKFADGYFTVLSEKNKIMSNSGQLGVSSTYYLVAFIKDGGSFDIDGRANTETINMLAIMNAVGNVEMPDTSLLGAIGCNSSIFTLLFIFLIVPILFYRKYFFQ